MASVSLRAFAAFLDSKDFKYRVVGDAEDIIATGMSGLKNRKDLGVNIFFGQNDTDIHIQSKDYLDVPEAKIPAIKEVCHTMNMNFRWAKFTVKEYNDGGFYVRIESDQIINPETAPAVCWEIMNRLIDIGDDAYPEFMKAMWGA